MDTSFFLKNNVLVFPRILTHKSGWNGTICTDPLTHECNPSNLDFRKNYCARGVPFCNHMHIFDSTEPYLKVKASQLPNVAIDVLNQVFTNQIVLFHSYAPPDYDIRHAVFNMPSTMIGFYRIKSISVDPINSDFYKIHPYEDAWIRFPKLVSLQYYWSNTDDKMSNIKSLPSSSLKEIMSYMTKPDVNYHDAKDEKRLKNAWDKIDEWLTISNDGIDSANKLLNAELDSYRRYSNGSQIINNPFKNSEQLKNLVVAPAKESTPTKEITKSKDTIKETQWQEAIQHLSEKLQTQFYLAWHSKPLIILSGEPGCGKSQIARTLVKPEHRCIIAVSSSFSSQEDLFGYYNPVNAKFHAFTLVSFLIECEKDWLKGDKSPRVIVLEEMNIAQPEHYMSDILSKTQYPEDDVKARTIHFPGSEIEGYPKKTSVMLSPAIKFVATVNIDHSVRKLTQRVLDRAAIVKIEISPSTILSHLNLKNLPGTLTQCLTNLNAVLDGRYRFSYRTGTSLCTAISILTQNNTSNNDIEQIAFQALDLVLVQEVWPRISASLRSDFHPERILENLSKWKSGYSDLLQHSAAIIDDWNERFEQGNNIDTMGI